MWATKPAHKQAGIIVHDMRYYNMYSLAEMNSTSTTGTRVRFTPDPSGVVVYADTLYWGELSRSVILSAPLTEPESEPTTVRGKPPSYILTLVPSTAGEM